MRERSLARWCRRELREMGIEAPLNLGLLGERIADRRGKVLQLQPHPLEVGIYGLWLSFVDTELVLYQAETSPEHQKDIILHEFGHILAGHGSDEADPDALRYLLPNLPPGVIEAGLRRTCFDAEHEYEAELVATIISEWSERIDHVTPSRSTGRARWVDAALNDTVGWS